MSRTGERFQQQHVEPGLPRFRESHHLGIPSPRAQHWRAICTLTVRSGAATCSLWKVRSYILRNTEAAASTSITLCSRMAEARLRALLLMPRRVQWMFLYGGTGWQ